VAPERKRSARDYEQALRRQELAAGRALVQALGGEGSTGAEGSTGPRELAAARRVLTQSLFELRRLGRDLDQEIETLRSRKPGAAGAAARTAVQRSNPGELERLEAVRNAVEEVAERWEGRRDQLSAELERRQPGRGRQGRRPGRPDAPGARGARQSAAPRPARRDGEVRNRGAADPARPGRPRSPRSRRSRG
jgi:hypothetical protein